MAESWIDLRSDTVTRPSAGMRKAMAEAVVGDDVFGDDPTVNKLQEKLAGMMGKEAALFVPSGSMANQIAVRIQTRPGDELLCEETAHVYLYEGGGRALHSGVTCRTLVGKRGILDVVDFDGKVRPIDDHFVRTRMVAIENTHNKGGGTVYPLANIERISAWARVNKLAVHLDGARLMNAVAKTQISLPTWASHFDTVSMCFSKGLGAPVGSILAGPAELIREARRVRKQMGGGMRQAGILAAACIYAIDNNVKRLVDDHEHAQMLALAFAQTAGFSVKPIEVETNLVWVKIDPALGSAEKIVAQFLENGILILAAGPDLIRLVTHLDVTRNHIERVIAVIRQMGTGAPKS